VIFMNIKNKALICLMFVIILILFCNVKANAQSITKQKDELNGGSISIELGNILKIQGEENSFGSYSYTGGSWIKEIRVNPNDIIEYEVNGDKSVLTITPQKVGNTTLTVKSANYSGFGGTPVPLTEFEVTIVVTNNQQLIEDLEDYLELDDVRISDLNESATAQQIKAGVLNDAENNYENVRVKPASTLRVWVDTINDYLRNEGRSANPPQEYARVRTFLNELIAVKNNGGDGSNAVNNNQEALDDSAEFVRESRDSIREGVEQALTRLRHELQSFSMGTRQSAGPFYDVLGSDTDVYTPNNVTGSPRATQEINKVLSYVTTVGMIISVLSLVVMGVKFMLASVEERADYKGALIPYVIGACLLFGICSIVKILEEFGNKINGII